MKVEVIRKALEMRKDKSAWNRGISEYAFELLDDIEDRVEHDRIELTLDNVKECALNGAKNWKEYSYGACSLIYDGDIAKRLCTPSEFKRKDGGRLYPRKNMTWLDLQARALYQAFNRIESIMRKEEKKNEDRY